jgi:hypothetical protein
MKAKSIQGVPTQYEGSFHDTESQKNIIVPEVLDSKFNVLKERFYSINNWKDYTGSGFADFDLFDSIGLYINTKPRVGDFVRIDIPGPGDVGSRGYDWVKIEGITVTINDEQERHLITCRPSASPGENPKYIKHFYSDRATSTFLIEKGTDYIKVGIYGRNEMPNKKNTGLLGKIRNLLVSFGGFLKLTKIQWKALADGLLDF